MPESALDGLCVVRFIYTQSSNQMVVTHHVRTGAASANTDAGLDGLAAAVAGWFDTVSAQALFNSQVELTQTEVADLSPTALETRITPSGEAGDRGTPLSSVTAAVVTKRTGFQGRAFRGRCYFPGGTESDLSGNGLQWDGSYVASLANYLDDFATAISTASPVEYAPVLWHRTGYGDPVTGVDTVTPVTSYLGRTRMATQRRRIPGL